MTKTCERWWKGAAVGWWIKQTPRWMCLLDSQRRHIGHGRPDCERRQARRTLAPIPAHLKPKQAKKEGACAVIADAGSLDHTSGESTRGVRKVTLSERCVVERKHHGETNGMVRSSSQPSCVDQQLAWSPSTMVTGGLIKCTAMELLRNTASTVTFTKASEKEVRTMVRDSTSMERAIRSTVWASKSPI